jgi:hypothetical protein
MDKKGTGRDIILIVILVFTAGIVFFISNFIGSTIVQEVKNAPGMNDPLYTNQFNATSAIENTINTGNSMYDKVIFGLFMGLVISLIVTSYLVGGYPIFMIFYFLFIVVAVISSVLFADVYTNLVSNTYYDFGTTWAAFPLTNNLIHYLPFYIAAVGVIGMIVMFAKPKEERLT